MKHPKCSRIPQTRYRFGGYLADYLAGVTEQWLKAAPLANPAMLEIFRDRDRQPLRDMVPWAGEFAGKYLTSAVQILRLTQDRKPEDFCPELCKSACPTTGRGRLPRSLAPRESADRRST